MSEEDKELEQIRRLNLFRRFLQAIVKRRLWVAVLAFALVSGVTGKFVIERARNAPNRFQATTTMIFSPKHSREVRTVDNQEILQLIRRREMVLKLADKLQIDPGDAAQIEISQERNQKNIFVITVFAADEQSAIRKGNEFARLCTSEYAAYRGADLAKNWEMPILVRQKKALEDREALDRAEAELRKKHNDIDLAAVRNDSMGISDIIRQRREDLFACEKELSGWRVRHLKAMAELALIPPPVVSNITNLSRLMTNYETANREWEEQSIQYTEKHPRLQLKEEQRKRALEGVKSSLTELGEPDFPLDRINRVGKLIENKRLAEGELEKATDRREGIVREISRLEDQRQSLLDIKNEMDRLSLARERLPSLQEYKRELIEIQDLESAASSELTQVERLQYALGDSILSKKNMMIMLAAGGIFAFLVLVVIILLELAFGKVANAEELSYHPELLPLGALPKDDKFASEDEQKSVTDGIFFRFRNAGIKWGTTLIGRLPGAERSPTLESSFNWNFAMSGKRSLVVHIVKALEFKEPPDAKFLGGVVRSGTSAWFPVANDESLSPGELHLLAEDLKTLHHDFDVICLTRKRSLRVGELAVSQLFAFCDSVMLLVGVGKTRRSDLRSIIELDRRHASHPIPVIATGVKGKDALKEGNTL